MELVKLRATLGEPRRGTGAGQNGGHVARKTRGGDADAATNSHTSGPGDDADAGCGRSRTPLFYSVRPKTSRAAKDIEGIGVELPAAGDVAVDPDETSSVASVDSVEGGRVFGWACHRSSKSSSTESVYVYAIVDDTVVAAVDVMDTYGNRELSTEVQEICLMKGEADPGVMVFKFDIGLPPLPQGIHTLRVLIRDAGAPDSQEYSKAGTHSSESSGPSGPSESSRSPSAAALVEAFHSPLMFEETVNEPSMAAIIKRKDEIITHRNNLLTKIWNEVHTQLPWRRYEQDAVDIPLGDLRGGGGDAPDLLAFIVVRSNPGRQEQRAAIRKTWEKNLEGNRMMSRFFVETQFSGPHKDALDREMTQNHDILPITLNADRSEETDGLLGALHYAVKHHDASFYFVVADDLLVLPHNLRKYLTKKLTDGNTYMGCMKSGAIVTDAEKMWYEPLHGRFGDGKGKVYPTHARSAMFGFSRLVARHLARSREVLQRYAHTDTTIGTWMLGLDVVYDDNEHFCADWRSCSVGDKPMGAKDPACEGMCHPQNMEEGWKLCAANAPPG